MCFRGWPPYNAVEMTGKMDVYWGSAGRGPLGSPLTGLDTPQQFIDFVVAGRQFDSFSRRAGFEQRGNGIGRAKLGPVGIDASFDGELERGPALPVLALTGAPRAINSLTTPCRPRHAATCRAVLSLAMP